MGDARDGSPGSFLKSVGRSLRRTGTALLDQVAPQFCIYCDQTTNTPEAVCEVCFAEFERNDTACPRCALPYGKNGACPDCAAHTWSLDRILAPFVYDPAIAFLLRRWKYEKQRYCAEIAAKMALNAHISVDQSALLLPTPLHWSRRLRRGFNQSEDLLTSILGKIENTGPGLLRSPGRPRLLRTRATAKQSLASRAERGANLSDAFRLKGAVRDRPVVLIDDICTTGATGEAMASVLKNAGATSVTLWCVARTPRPD